ncbi:hypothetical protein LTR84_000848 [Exophiala bonariae]|uniref:Nucleoside phosphorylase domain-containing protein n=1 Tax=Exophiala bonariae TaxID=1690606 RepID=A0AAV9NVU4_9EURO|nr:hypothetical protein LTR84_000848 [Exophiala bonariae]
MAGKMRLFKLIVIGDGGVGKTCLVIQLVQNHFVETYDPTIEDSYRKQVLIDKEASIIEVLDTAGQEEYTALRDQWIRDSEAAVLVYSVTSRQSFERINKFNQQLLRVKESASSHSIFGSATTLDMATPKAPLPVMLVANKADREDEREVTTAEGFALARELQCMFVESSAKSCINVEKAFYDLVRELRLQQRSAVIADKIKVPVPPERTNRNGRTRKVYFGSFSSLLRLLPGFKVNLREEYRHDVAHQLAIDKVLVQAARLNDIKAVKKCLTNGANPNAQSGSEGSALQAAAVLGHSKIVRLLLENGAAPNAKGPREMTALQAAAAEGHRDVVSILLKAGADVNTTSSLHGTALLAAASRGQVEVARLLIKYRADVNAKGGQYGNALQAAAVVGKLEMVSTLLDAGASHHARGEGDCTALQATCNAGHANLARLLLDRGSDINARPGRFGTALQAANDSSRFDVFNLLLSYGADVAVLSPQPSAEQVNRNQGSNSTIQAPDIENGEGAAEPSTRLASPHSSEPTFPVVDSCSIPVVSYGLMRDNAAGDTEPQCSNAATPRSPSQNQSNLPNAANPLPPRTNYHLPTHTRFLSYSQDPTTPLVDKPEHSLSRTGEQTPAWKTSALSNGHLRSRSLNLSHHMYTVAIICPMAVELAPVEAMLDVLHPNLPTSRLDHNVYSFGSLGEHNVVIAVMPGIGTNSSAVVATQLLHDFPSIRFTLLVGIGGGIPDDENDIRLGDVVVSRPTNIFGGVVQYDMGKCHPNGLFQRTGALRKPPPILSATVEKLRSRHLRDGTQITEHLVDMMTRFPKLMNVYSKPDSEHDRLFQDSCNHSAGQSCLECGPEHIVAREPRNNPDPKVHYGTIGSANALVRDSLTRNRLKQDSGIICVEMEAAGLMETFPCLVIRGICDYADSHKTKIWQPYAAAAAAAYMKEVLLMIPPKEIVRESRAIDVWI